MTDEEDVIIVSDRGMVIRMNIMQINRTKRATQGVRLIHLKGSQTVSTLAIVPHEDEEEEKVVQESLDLIEQTPADVEVLEIEISEDEEQEKNDAPETLFDL